MSTNERARDTSDSRVAASGCAAGGAASWGGSTTRGAERAECLKVVLISRILWRWLQYTATLLLLLLVIS